MFIFISGGIKELETTILVSKGISIKKVSKISNSLFFKHWIKWFKFFSLNILKISLILSFEKGKLPLNFLFDKINSLSLWKQ